MQILNASPDEERFTKLYTEHKGETLLWDLKFYGRPTNANVENVFAFINTYFATLSVEKQDAIFEAYKVARQTLDEVIDPTQLHVKLTEAAMLIYNEMSFDDIRYWARTHGSIRIPSSIKETYKELDISDRNQVGMDYQSRTYLRSDYLELVNMSIFLKPMIPIWAEYAKMLEQINNSNSFREYQAMSILNKTSIVSTEPMDRLRSYIETSTVEKSAELSAALGGVGSSELPDWLMSIVIIRKLVIINLSSYDDSDNIVSVVYHHVRNTIKSIDRKFSGRIREKAKPRGDDDEENKSLVETYKIKQSISDGDVMVLSVYTENSLALARKISPDIDARKVKRCRSAVRSIIQKRPTNGQLVILRWIVSSVIPPQSIDNINKVSLLSCMAAAQAVLWHWGLPDLALIITSSESLDGDGEFLGGVDSRSRIPKEYVDTFVELYPHYQEKGSKERERQTNVACKAIDNTAKDFIRCDWITHAHPDLVALGTSVNESGIMSAPSDIRTQLSKLVLTLVEKQEEIDNQKIL